MAHEITHEDHFLNFELIKQARGNGLYKHGFVPGGDPSQMGGAPGGGAPPGADPSQGAPPGGGGAPPPAGGPDPLDQVLQRLQTLEQNSQAGGAGPGGAAAGMIKPKVDVNIEIMQIKKMLARVIDHLQIPVQAEDFATNQQDLQGMAANPGADPSQAAGQAGGAGAIAPIPPMQPSGVPGQQKAGGYKSNGKAFDVSGLVEMGNKAAAVLRFREQGRSA